MSPDVVIDIMESKKRRTPFYKEVFKEAADALNLLTFSLTPSQILLFLFSIINLK